MFPVSTLSTKQNTCFRTIRPFKGREEEIWWRKEEGRREVRSSSRHNPEDGNGNWKDGRKHEESCGPEDGIRVAIGRYHRWTQHQWASY